VENKLAEHDKQGKPIYRLENLLADPTPGGASQEYRSLAGLVSKKMKIPESGVW